MTDSCWLVSPRPSDIVRENPIVGVPGPVTCRFDRRSKSEQVPVPRLRRCIRCLSLIQLRQIPVESFRFDDRLRLRFVCRPKISARRVRRSTNLPEAGITLEFTLKTVGQG